MNQNKNTEETQINILFLCVANSARSQIAEGLAKKILGNACHIESAGSEPSGVVQPKAIEVLREVNIDILSNYSKSINDLDPSFLANLDFVISLCQEESCPIFNVKSTHLHWPLPDPAANNDAENEHKVLDSYRSARAQIETKLFELAKQIQINTP